MKKICFAFNHFTYSNGVARSAIGIANYLCQKEQCQVTLRPIFQMDKSALDLLDKRVIIKPVFGFYFSGLTRIVSLLPKNILHNLIFNKNRYDIEVGFQHGIATKAVVSSKKSNSKHIIWIHGYDEKLTLKKYLKKADKIVCVSKHNRDKLKKDLRCDVQIDYCYNPLDDVVIREQGEETIDIPRPDVPLFITVGRLSVEKGYTRLVRVVSKLVAEGNKFHLWIIGDGPEYDAIYDEIQKNGVEETVRLLGAQKNPHKFTSKADLFICSSYSEGYSTACTEAVILGVPVLTTDVSGGKEIVDDAESGMVVGLTDDDLYHGIKDILSDYDRIKTWRNNLVNTQHRFSYIERIKKLDQILEFNTIDS